MLVHLFKILITLSFLLGTSLSTYCAEEDVNEPGTNIPDNILEGNADNKKAPSSYYDEKEKTGTKGWFWYEPEPPPKKKNKDVKKKTSSPKEEKEEKEEKKWKAPRYPKLDDYEYEDLWYMHPDDFQELIAAFHKKSVQYPTNENVTEYYKMVDIARRKSLVFANVASSVMSENSDLSMSTIDPDSIPGRAASIRTRVEEIKKGMLRYSKLFDLIYFSKDSSEYSAEQSKINALFTEKNNWDFMNVNINKNYEFANSYGVKTAPAIILVSKENSKSYKIVSSSVVSVDEIEGRIHRVARMLLGELSPQDFSTYEHYRGTPLDPLKPLRDSEQKKKQNKSK